MICREELPEFGETVMVRTLEDVASDAVKTEYFIVKFLGNPHPAFRDVWYVNGKDGYGMPRLIDVELWERIDPIYGEPSND